MDNHAQTSSLAEQIRALQARYAKQEQELAELRANHARARRIAEIFREAGAPPRPLPGPEKRDRHGMYLVKGGAAGAGLVAVVRWAVGSWPRRIITASAALAVAGGTVLTPPVQSVTNPPQPHHVPRAGRATPAIPAGPPPRHYSGGGSGPASSAVRTHSSPGPPHATPSPSPAPPSGGPTPVPVPTPTLPTPSPTLPQVCLKHPLNPQCDNDGDSVADVVDARQWLIKTHRLKLLGDVA